MNRILAKEIGCPFAVRAPRGARARSGGAMWSRGLVFGAAWVLASTGMAAVAGAPPRYADLSLEQLMDLKVERVYGASRRLQKVTDAPSAVSIVTADDIRQFGWRSLADLLRSVRGFYASDDRNYTYLGTRGFKRPGDFNTRLLVLIDGHRMNDNVYDGAFFGRESMIALGAIERVEVIRGPSSSIYGSSAFFGVVNIVTKREAAVTVDVGTLGSYEGRASWHRRFANGVEWQITGTQFTSGGEKRLYFPEFDQRRSAEPGATNNGIAEDADRERSAHLFTALSYRDLTLSAFASRRTKAVPTASYGTIFNDGRERTADRRGYVDLKLDRTMGDYRLLGRTFFDQYRYNGQYPYDYTVPGGVPDISLDTDGAIGEWIGTEWQVNGRLSSAHAFIGGVEFRESLRERQFAVFGGVTTLDHQERSRNLGVFGQWEFTPRRGLQLNAGLRYDRYFGSFGGTLNPRLAAIYHPTSASAIKLLYGEAFRAPNPYERFYYEASLLAAPLRPERIRTQELILERYWGAAYRASLSVYHYDVRALISQTATPAGDLFFENAGTTHADGAEVEFEAKQDSGWLVRTSYALQRAEDRTTRTELTSSPASLAKLNLGWSPARRGLSAGLEFQYHSGQRTLGGSRTADALIGNLHLATEGLMRDCEVSLSVSNLFNSHYRLPGAEDLVQDALAQRGRVVHVRITRTF